MAKTNPYNQRHSATLAFEDEPAGDGSRSARREEVFPRERFREDAGPEEALYPRPRRRAPVEQSRWARFRWTGFLLRTRLGLVVLAVGLSTAAVLLVLADRAARRFLEQDPHFRIASSSSIQILGADPNQGGVGRPELLGIFGADIGRNIFFVPLRARQTQLEQLPWVAHATVMRLLPDRLSVTVVERVPVAFVRLGSRVGLADAEGVLLTLPPAVLAARHYSFPVVTGVSPSDPPEARAARMHLYTRFVAELDSGGAPASAPISAQLSEVDLADLEDVRAIVPAQGTDILLHFGDSDFLARYRSYQQHLGEWRQQYPHLSAIDLRYDRQVVLKMADGAESEASSVDTDRSRVNSLTPAPPHPAAHPAAHPAGHAAPFHGPHHPAGHGAAHGWSPR